VVINDLIGDSPTEVNDLEVQTMFSTVTLQRRKRTAQQRVSFSFKIYNNTKQLDGDGYVESIILIINVYLFIVYRIKH